MGNECDSKFQVHESPASLPRVVGISGIMWGPGEGVTHVVASRAPLDSWRGALPAPPPPHSTPAITRTRPRSREHTRALSFNTERARPRASSIPELPPGCAPGLPAAAPMPFSLACVLIFFFFFNFLFLPVHVAKCAKLGSDGLPEFAPVCFVGGGWESKKATLQPQCPATGELPAGLSEGTVGLSRPSTVPQTI